MIFHVVDAALFALFLALFLTVRTVDSRMFHCLSIAGSTAAA